MTVGSGPARVRAWMLLQVDAPLEAAQRIYEELGHQGGDSFVLVRADLVEDNLYNLVVPVDAESLHWLDYVQQRIQHLAAVRRIAILRVTEHIPWPPHVADGYISPEEAAVWVGEPVKVGRQHHSPGLNAWG